jgi:hypothetical protein
LHALQGDMRRTILPEFGVGMTVPLNRARIRAGIAESLAMRQAAESYYRAAESDVLGNLVLALVSLRDTERVQRDYSAIIIPTTDQLLDLQTTAYRAGEGDFLDILDTERILIDSRIVLLRPPTNPFHRGPRASGPDPISSTTMRPLRRTSVIERLIGNIPTASGDCRLLEVHRLRDLGNEPTPVDDPDRPRTR